IRAATDFPTSRLRRPSVRTPGPARPRLLRPTPHTGSHGCPSQCEQIRERCSGPQHFPQCPFLLQILPSSVALNGSATARPCGPHSALHGIGFLTADKVAKKLGIAKTAMIRVRAGVSYALAEAIDEGHCGLPADDLAALTAKLIEVPAALIDT